jgi:hypothetical protein
LIFARLKMWAVGIGLVFAALAASWLGGRKTAQADAKQEEFEAYAETRKRMDEVARMSDADASHDWLRERGKH